MHGECRTVMSCFVALLTHSHPFCALASYSPHSRISTSLLLCASSPLDLPHTSALHAWIYFAEPVRNISQRHPSPVWNTLCRVCAKPHLALRTPIIMSVAAPTAGTLAATPPSVQHCVTMHQATGASASCPVNMAEVIV